MIRPVLLRCADLSWQDGALCTGMNPEVFYPDRGENAAGAKAVCKMCPVRQQCLDFALATDDGHGIWGGLSERERRDVRRQRRDGAAESAA